MQSRDTDSRQCGARSSSPQLPVDTSVKKEHEILKSDDKVSGECE